MLIGRRQMFAYLAVAAVVATVGVRYLVASRAAASPGATLLTAVPAAVAPGASSAALPQPQVSLQPLVAYACGAVARPGVYRLLPEARVADLLALAGGATAKADLTAINLAAKVTDGQQVVVPLKPAAAAAAGPQVGAAAPPAAGAAGSSAAAVGGATAPLVNLNTATLEELDTLEGVGPVTAQKIVDYRTANGGFKSIDELKNVPGIGDVRFAAVKDSVTI